MSSHYETNLKPTPCCKYAEHGDIVKRINYLKAGFTVVLAVYGIICARDVMVPFFLDQVEQSSFCSKQRTNIMVYF